MPKRAKEYRRLCRRKRSFLFGNSSLWLGTDHLLSVHSKYFSEDYKRFYYQDIQSLITYKTGVGKIQNLTMGLFGLLCIALAFLTQGVWAWPTMFWIMAGLMLVLLLINRLRSPTCVCHLKTAVQTEKLPSLCRLRIVQKAFGLLEPFIENAQGSLTRDELRENMVAGQLQETKAADPIRPEQPPTQESGRTHQALFYLLLFGGLLTAIDLFFNHIAITLLGSIIGIGICISTIMALVRQYDSKIPGALRAITWTTLAFVCLDFCVSYAFFIVLAVKNPDATHNQWELIKRFAALSPLDSSWQTAVFGFAIIVSLVLGITGLVLLRSYLYAPKPTSAPVHITPGRNPEPFQV